MYGAILDKFNTLGGPDGSGLGFPTNDEGDTGDGVRSSQRLHQTRWGVHLVESRHGCVGDQRQGAGSLEEQRWRQGPFGYPTSDIADVNG